jgi:FkbH-like protein
MPGLELFDFAAVVEQVGVAAARNSESEVLARMPYSPALYQALGIALVRQILARRRSPAKVIAVDCDDTLWGGVLGEVGLDGIKLGSDGAGRGFQLFQRRLKQLKERGMLLAVVSKNEEADVLRVFENHPEMVLRPDDIAAWRVNWRHKSENLQELAEEMNLGIDSFVLLDDNAAVRMEVSMRLPGVHVVPLPEDSARYCETLERLWLFDGAQATEADRKRTRMMQEESQRKRIRKTAASLDDYLASLELEVDIREPDDTEWARVAQLTQRTNQFNLSLKHRTTEEVKALAGEDSLLIIKASDRFGDYGLVGVCIISKSDSAACEIDTLLMSCRVLGRGAEDAFLHAMARTAAAKGAARLVAPFVPGPRNQLMKDFLARSGFRETQPNTWVLPVTEIPPLPKHIRWVGGKEQVAVQSVE